jgi:hypothetical protein
MTNHLFGWFFYFLSAKKEPHVINARSQHPKNLREFDYSVICNEMATHVAS